MQKTTTKKTVIQEIPNEEFIAPLQQSDTFEGKIQAIIKFLKINSIHCHIKEHIRKPVTSFKRKFEILDVTIGRGTPSYINSYMNTVWKYLDEEIEKLTESDTGYHNIRKTLLESKNLCYHELQRYDITDLNKFEAIGAVTLVSKGKFFPAMLSNVEFTELQKDMLREHCRARFSFLNRLFHYLDSKLTSFINIPEIMKSPYEWNSPNKEMEIAELLYALTLSGRINIIKGNESQFREQFYQFFGLKDKDYNKRKNSIKNRAERPALLNELRKILIAAP